MYSVGQTVVMGPDAPYSITSPGTEVTIVDFNPIESSIRGHKKAGRPLCDIRVRLAGTFGVPYSISSHYFLGGGDCSIEVC